MALVMSQNFAADAAPAWEQQNQWVVSGWRSGSDTLDADYPYIKLTENLKVTTGAGPSGENIAEPFSATGGDASVTSLEFQGFGPLTDGDYDLSKIARVKIAIYFDADAMDDGYGIAIGLIGRNGSAVPLGAQSVFIDFYQDSGDTWRMGLNVKRWGTTDLYVDTYTFSRAAVEGTWHTLELQFTHCTVNDYSTNDVETDGIAKVLLDDVEIYSETGAFTLSNTVNWQRGASISYGFYGVVGGVTNIEYHDSLETVISGSHVFGEQTRVTASRAVAFGLDGNENTHDEEGVLKVFGKHHVTEEVKALSRAAGTGAAAGNKVSAGRNTSGNGAAGVLELVDKSGTSYYLWVEAGELRIHTAPPTEDDTTVSHTAGTVVGTQS